MDGRAGRVADFRGYLADCWGVATGIGAAEAAFAGGSGEVEAAVSFVSGIVARPNEGRRAQFVFAVFLHQRVAGASYPAAGVRKSGRWGGRELPAGREPRALRLECLASAAREWRGGASSRITAPAVMTAVVVSSTMRYASARLGKHNRWHCRRRALHCDLFDGEEALDAFSGEDFSGVNDAFRVDGDHMKAEELAAVFAHAAHLTDHFAVLAV
jgi:hypothetical protein